MCYWWTKVGKRDVLEKQWGLTSKTGLEWKDYGVDKALA